MTNSTLPLPATATSPVPTPLQPKQPPTYVSSKLTREHLQRSAILYVRQSTGQQLGSVAPALAAPALLHRRCYRVGGTGVAAAAPTLPPTFVRQ